jgi:hypothetical protein
LEIEQATFVSTLALMVALLVCYKAQRKMKAPRLCAPKAQTKMRAWAHLQSIRSFVKRNLNLITHLGGNVEQIPKVGI